MPQPFSKIRLVLSALLLANVKASSNDAINFALAEVFPQLVGITKNPNTGLSLTLGGQDLGHCCSLAVFESLDVVDGIVKGLRSPSFIGDDLATFVRRPFPCDASFTGN